MNEPATIDIDRPGTDEEPVRDNRIGAFEPPLLPSVNNEFERESTSLARGDEALCRAAKAAGIAKRTRDDVFGALESFLEARAAAQRCQIGPVDTVDIDSRIARCFLTLGWPEKAVEYAESAYRRALELPVGEVRARAFNAMAQTQALLAHDHQAQATFRRLARELKGCAEQREQAHHCYINHGACCVREALRPHTSAQRREFMLRRALRMNRLARCVQFSPMSKLYAPRNDAEIYGLLGRLADAQSALAELKALLRSPMEEDVGLQHMRFSTLQLEGELEVLSGRPERGAALLAEAITISEAMGILQDLPDWLEALSDAEERCGRYREALLATRRAARIRLDRARAQGEARLRVLEAEQGMDRARQAIESERRRANTSERMQKALLDDAKRLGMEADTDALTGLGNRRVFSALSKTLAATEGEPIAMLMLDLDHFKTVNDIFSHAIGDKVLSAFAGVLRRVCRANDVLVRLGGEEFVVVLRGVSPAVALRISERLREAVERHPWRDLNASLQVTVSIGVACARTPLDATTLLAESDALLYAAKAAGRNRVMTA